MTSRSIRLVSVFAAGALLFAACSDSDDGGGSDTTASETTETTEAPSGAWAVNTEDCADPDAAVAPISGTLKVGTVVPLSGGTAALAFAPVAEGMKAYVDYANENDLIPGVTLELEIGDDQYNKDLTPTAVNDLLDGGVQAFTGIVGTDGNLAVRDTLNEECVPQIQVLSGSPSFKDAENYAWTTPQLAPYDVETKVYAKQLAELFPEGVTVGLYHVNTEFGLAYADTLKEVAAEYGIEIVEEQTIEPTETAPPTAQLNALAASGAEAIIAVPLGSQCPTFMKEVANAKAANAGWDPKVFITNTCASPLILGVAGDAANGLYTSNFLEDIGDPAKATIPNIKTYLDYMTARGQADIVTTAAAGWSTMEAAVAIFAQAAASEAGLTRASIIEAARSLEHVPMLGREGVVLKTNGASDQATAESLTVVQYNAAAKTFADIGSLISDFES